jgi:integrase
MRANNEGTIYQRKDGRWVACVTQFKDGKRKRVYRYADSEEEARKQLTDLKHRQDHHQPIQFDHKSVGAFLQMWLETFIRPRRKPRTWASYHHTIHKYVLPAIGKEPLSDLAPELIQEVINYHYERRRQRTAAYIRTILRGAFERAVKLKRMAWNPVDALDTVTVSARETEVYTAEQAEKFLKAAESHRLEALFWVAIGMGLRKSELCGLPLTELDLEDPSIHVCETIQRVKLPGEKKSHMIQGSPKSKASQRSLPIPDCVLEALQRHMARREEQRLLAGTAWKESGRVFTTTIGSALDGDNLTKAFQEIADAAKVPRIRFHDLRHTCGTFLHAQGVSPFTIQEILGHSQLVTTRRYTHVDAALQKSALGKVGELLKKPERKTGTDATDSSFDSRSAVKAAVKTKLVRVK